MRRAVTLVFLFAALTAPSAAEGGERRLPKPRRLRQMVEFVHALHLTDDGQDYLHERLPKQDGFTRRRINVLREQMYISPKKILELVGDPRRPPALRALALRFLPHEYEGLDRELVERLLGSNDAGLQLEAVRTLQRSSMPTAAAILRKIARNEHNSVDLRAEAVLGLSFESANSKSRELLLKLAESDSAVLRTESLRSLRGLAANNIDVRRTLLGLSDSLKLAVDRPSVQDRELAEQLLLSFGGIPMAGVPEHVVRISQDSRPNSVAQWQRYLNTGGNPAAGRRVFFHSKSAACFKCHTVAGRGYHIGPALSGVGRSWDRKMLVKKLVAPSPELAYRYTNWSVVTNSGKIYGGMIVEEDKDQLWIGKAYGEVHAVETTDIEVREPLKTSVMPTNIVSGLTGEEFRNLLAFLEQLWQ